VQHFIIILLQTDAHTGWIQFSIHVGLRLAPFSMILLQSFYWKAVSTHKVYQSKVYKQYCSIMMT